MPKIHSELLSNGATALSFYCAGCKQTHEVNSNKNCLWQFNGDIENPTLAPSILVRSVKMTEQGEADYEAWCNAGYPKRDAPFDSVNTVCHSFVTAGSIQYLSDCTHALAGQTIALPEFKWEEGGENV